MLRELWTFNYLTYKGFNILYELLFEQVEPQPEDVEFHYRVTVGKYVKDYWLENKREVIEDFLDAFYSKNIEHPLRLFKDVFDYLDAEIKASFCTEL